MRKSGGWGLLYQRNPEGKVLQCAQRTLRLVQIVYLVFYSGPYSLVGPFDVEVFHYYIMWQNATVYDSVSVFHYMLYVHLLDFHGYAAYGQIYVIGLCRHVLVEPSQQVREAPLHSVVAHSAAANLVRYEDECGILCGESVEFRLNFLQCCIDVGCGIASASIKIEIRTPKCKTVNHRHLIIYIYVPEEFFLLYVCPLASPALLVLVHPLLEFIVPDVCRGDIHRCFGEV